METRNYLLFTYNYRSSRDEVEHLNGRIIQKLTDRIFIAALPINIARKDITCSSFEEPNDLDPISILLVRQWQRWDQGFLNRYM